MYFSMLALIASPWWITRRIELSIKLWRFSSATCLGVVHDHTQFLMSWNIMLQHMLRPHHCLWDHKRRRRLTSPNDFDASAVCSAWSSQQHFYGFHLPFSIFKIASVLPILWKYLHWLPLCIFLYETKHFNASGVSVCGCHKLSSITYFHEY